MQYLDHANKISNLILVLEFPDGNHVVSLSGNDRVGLFNAIRAYLTRNGEPIKLQEDRLDALIRKVIIKLTKNQVDTMKMWLAKNNYLSEEEMLFISRNLTMLSKGKYRAEFTAIIGDNYPMKWWLENVPFGFIQKEL